jgi:hypothetical protein
VSNLGPIHLNQPIQIAQPVQIIASAASPVAAGAVTGILDNVLTTIVTYTPTVDKVITRISVSGTAYGKVELFTNASLIETQRMGPDRNLVINFLNPLILLMGIPLDVKITHYAIGETNDFEATVYGV